MNGNEIITITISNDIGGETRISTRYSVMQADMFRGTKGEFHLMQLDDLVKRYENEQKNQDYEKKFEK